MIKDVKGLDLSVDDLPVEKALGMIWDVEQDTLCFRVKHKDKPATKRGLLSTIKSIFDPPGFGQPVLPPMKVLIQDLCRKKYDWDDPIPQELKKEWSKWLSDLPKLKNFNVPRCYTPKDFGKIIDIQLHHFSDASEKSYGAVSYITITNTYEQVHCAIISGKTRLVPLKLNGSTIPRLELCAATITAKNDAFLKKELKLPISASYFWTDNRFRLKKAFAWILQGRNMLFPKLNANELPSNLPKENRIQPLSVTELRNAELEIIKYEQSKYFVEEIRLLSNNQEIPKSSTLISLRPFLKNDILRVGGRIKDAPISYDAKHPIVIPK
uniref:uncharacterized protein LOC120326708 n=1 Tax=Styela clava TaxID=7725 RepID=UPI00193AA5EF|nr:uncharacterized protein LOC120326708 [Styela clava]